MSSGGRSAPEWFGGGTGTAPGINSVEKDAIHRGSKKKHRRSKSDTSYLKSSSRKAAERERRERSKDKIKSKKHRRGRSKDIATNLVAEDAEIRLKVQRHETKPSSSSMNNDGTNSRDHRKLKTSHKRSKTLPHQQQKRGSFIERILGFGRSDNTPKDSEQQSVEPPGTASSLHFHVHKIEEKIDPEELHPFAPPTAVLPPARHNLSYFEAPPKPEDRDGYHQPHLAVISDQRAYVHSKSNSPNTTSAVIDHDAESDDLLTYSDDDTANSITYNPYQQPIAPSPLYPSYQTNEYYRNHESYQVMQQQRLIALSHAQPNAKANDRANSGRNSFNTYGSINDSGIDSLPPLHHKLPSIQDRFFPITSRDSNDMYISETDTLTSAHTQETYPNFDNFYFKRMKPNENIPISPPTSPNETENLLGPTQEDINAEKQEISPNSVNDLLDLDITSHRVNIKLNDEFTSSGNEVFCSTTIDDTTPAMMDQLSQKLSSNKVDNISDNSESSNRKTPPPSKSHSSGNANGINKAPTTQIQNIQKSHPPPPISSVQIVRTSGTETTVGSKSSSSPYNTMLKKSSSSSSHKIELATLSRKEKKRLRAKFDRAEKIEDYVQYLLHEHSGDDTFRLENTHENYSSLNARFFPPSQAARDVFFTVLFLIQYAIVFFLAFNNADETMLHSGKIVTDNDAYTLNTDDPFATGYIPNDNSSPISIWAKDIYVDYTNAVQLACITALYSTVLSALAIGMMMILNTAFIPTVLCVTVLACIGAGTIMALSPYTVMPVVALAALAISLAYSIVVWDRIPFATTNLHTALICIKSSADILVAGFAMMLVAFFWTILWMVAFLGIYDHYLDNADHELSNSISWYGLSVSLGMVLSYVWTFNVILVCRVIEDWFFSFIFRFVSPNFFIHSIECCACYCGRNSRIMVDKR